MPRVQANLVRASAFHVDAFLACSGWRNVGCLVHSRSRSTCSDSSPLRESRLRMPSCWPTKAATASRTRRLLAYGGPISAHLPLAFLCALCQLANWSPKSRARPAVAEHAQHSAVHAGARPLHGRRLGGLCCCSSQMYNYLKKYHGVAIMSLSSVRRKEQALFPVHAAPCMPIGRRARGSTCSLSGPKRKACGAEDR